MRTREISVVFVLLTVILGITACSAKSSTAQSDPVPTTVSVVTAQPIVSTSTAAEPSVSKKAASTTTTSKPVGSTPSAKPTAPTTTPAAKPGRRVITFVNSTSQTVWPAAQSSAKDPMPVTGWVLPPGATISFLIDDHYNGRIWGRTGCSFNSSGQGHCVTGDCDGHFQCGTAGSTAPETLAEFDLDAWDGMDFFDVNMDGFNLPMWINHTGGKTPDKISSNGCIPAGCTKNLLLTCPAILQIKSGGVVVGCVNPCQVLKTDNYCCNGAWAGRANCQPSKWPIDYAAIFKEAEPFAYSYAYDDSATYTCSGSCDYRITFGVSA
jgi:Thaumatin family